VNRRSPLEILEDAADHLDHVDAYSHRDLTDEMVMDAIAMRLSAAIEVLRRLPEDLRADVTGGTWPQMWGLRNRIAHGYGTVDPTIIEATLRSDIAGLRDRMQQAINDMKTS
jgi:uncharacterized protein with HEPN domain